MNDIQSYLSALQSADFSNELVNQKLQLEQQQKESTLPISEMLTLESGKLIAERAFEIAKTKGVDFLKNTIKTKMKEAGIDDETIDSTLQGDLTPDALSDKALDLISKVKSEADDIVDNVTSQVNDLTERVPTQEEVLEAASQRQQVQPTQEDLPEGAGTIEESTQEDLPEDAGTIEESTGNLTDTLDNLESTVRSNIVDAQGIADDLASQSMEQYSSILSTGRAGLSELQSGTSNIFQRLQNMFQPQIAEPADIEMVNLAPEVSSIVSPEISSTIAPEVGGILSKASDFISGGIDSATGAISGAVEGATGAISGAVEGGLEGAALGLDATGVLEPIGAILTAALGIFGIVEASRPEESTGILNPSSQFL